MPRITAGETAAKPEPSGFRLGSMLAGLGILLTLGGAAPASVSQPATVQTPAAPVEAEALSGIWWNQPRLIEALGLSEEQRERMDGRLRESLVERRRLQRELRSRRQRFMASITGSDWDAARTAGDQTAEALAALSRHESRVKIDILSQLDEAQLSTLTRQYPRLLARTWLLRRPITRRVAGP